MKPHQLIGLPYRLGADPVKHGAGDCLSLCRTVLKSYGISSPDPERSWYRRLRKKDYSIFTEELNRWVVDSPPKLGAIALCKSENGYGMAAYYEEGGLNYQKIFENRVVVWSPLNALMAHGCYYQRK